LTLTSNEEIEAIVAEVDNGTYKRKMPATSVLAEAKDTAGYIGSNDTELSERQ